MVTEQAKAITISFNPRHRRQILDLAKHREPGYPSFVTLKLVPNEGEAGWATLWYVGRPDGNDCHYHVQFAGESKVLPAEMKQDRLEVFNV